MKDLKETEQNKIYLNKYNAQILEKQIKKHYYKKMKMKQFFQEYCSY